MKVRHLIATAAAVTAVGTAAAAAPAAFATDGSVHNGWGYTLYTDYSPDDEYKVCDTAADGMSAVGWIEVRNADGTWYEYSHLRAAGNGTCASNDVNIIDSKEDRQVKVVVCRKNYPDGPLRDCESRIFSGA